MAEMTIHSPIPYGSTELKKAYQKYLSRALGIAVVLHLTAIGAYWLSQVIHGDEGPSGPVRILKYSELGPPPSIAQSNVAPPIAVQAPTVKPSVGVPVPVPDAMVNPEQTIASQEEMATEVSAGLEGLGDGAMKIEQDIKVE